MVYVEKNNLKRIFRQNFIAIEYQICSIEIWFDLVSSCSNDSLCCDEKPIQKQNHQLDVFPQKKGRVEKKREER